MTTHLYRHRDRYRVVEETAPRGCRLGDPHDLVVSVDTEEDYAFVRRVYAELFDGRPIETDRLIRWWGRQQQ